MSNPPLLADYGNHLALFESAILGLVLDLSRLRGTYPRMSVGYAEISSAYRTTLLGINPRIGEMGEPNQNRSSECVSLKIRWVARQLVPNFIE